jgi:DNA-nicking Smr family endonuclease
MPIDPKAREKILRYLDEHGVSNKDAASSYRPKKVDIGINKTKKRGLRKTIDLHGMNSENAELALVKAMDECRKKGIKELLIIHGWGKHSGQSEGVLKKLVRECLEYRYALAIRGYHTALPKDGGEGATLVTLK